MENTSDTLDMKSWIIQEFGSGMISEKERDEMIEKFGEMDSKLPWNSNFKILALDIDKDKRSDLGSVFFN